jgi:hypothetical protein
MPYSDEEVADLDVNIESFEMYQSDDKMFDNSRDKSTFTKFLNKHIHMRGFSVSLDSINKVEIEENYFLAIESMRSDVLSTNKNILNPCHVSINIQAKQEKKARSGDMGGVVQIVTAEMNIRNIELMPTFDQLCILRDSLNFLSVEQMKIKFMKIRHQLWNEVFF